MRRKFVIGIKRVSLLSSSRCASGLALFELDVDFRKYLSSEGAKFAVYEQFNAVNNSTAKSSKFLGRDHVAEADMMVADADLVEA